MLEIRHFLDAVCKNFLPYFRLSVYSVDRLFCCAEVFAFVAISFGVYRIVLKRELVELKTSGSTFFSIRTMIH